MSLYLFVLAYFYARNRFPLSRKMLYVEPLPGDWFRLGDGQLVRGAGAVNRIHEEQQILMGKAKSEEPKESKEPKETLKEIDALPDGQIPQAGQLQRGYRERDATCHPNGGWEVDPGFSRAAGHTAKYEALITSAPGLDYVVRNPGKNPVKFDGCAV